MTTYKRNIGTNRGKPRLWLEGKILLDNGFPHKAPWDVERMDARTLVLAVCTSGKRLVAGSAGRPVIDINSAGLLEGFAGEVTVTVVKPGYLLVTMGE